MTNRSEIREFLAERGPTPTEEIIRHFTRIAPDNVRVCLSEMRRRGQVQVVSSLPAGKFTRQYIWAVGGVECLERVSDTVDYKGGEHRWCEHLARVARLGGRVDYEEIPR